jgi:hypothetical protein
VVSVCGLFSVEPALADRVDCAATEATTLRASDGEPRDEFGLSVSVSGNVAVVGSFKDDDACHRDPSCDSGSAYVFRYDADTGFWEEEAKLTSVDTDAGDRFGLRVAVDGDVAVVGADLHDSEGFNAGAAYVFRYDDRSRRWRREAKLTSSDSDSLDFFGWWVAVSGDVIAVGATGDDERAASAGAVYVFRYDAVSREWIEEAKLTAADADVADRFGRSVSVSGEVILVGSQFDDDIAGDSGSGYVFRFDPASGQWAQEAKLTASDAGFRDNLGVSVAIDGNVALLGAHSESRGALVTSGAAYVFRLNEGTGQWQQESKLTASDAENADFFGISVALEGDVALIGAFRNDNGCPDVLGCDSGSAYVYRYDGHNTWFEEAHLTSFLGAQQDLFGFAVALSGDIGVAGVVFDDDNGIDSGSAKVFRGLTDCDGNRDPDLCDILDDPGTDLDGNGILDVCEDPPGG